LIDLIHGLFLQQQINPGVLNYAIQRILGDPLPPSPNRSPGPVGRAWSAATSCVPRNKTAGNMYGEPMSCPRSRETKSQSTSHRSRPRRGNSIAFLILLINDKREFPRGNEQGDAQRQADRNPQNFVTSEQRAKMHRQRSSK
jgi:hypothetical protein